MSGPLTLAIGLSGNTHGALEAGGHGLVLRRDGKAVIRYTGLAATDARGHALESWLSLEGGQVLLHVDAARAPYPIRIDPFLQEGEKLTGSGESGLGEFGESVALSSDGNTALIGGSGDHDFVGAAWVFTRSAGKWSQQGEKLTGTGESGRGEFGWSVALSSSGNTAVIGGPADNGRVGAAWVFTRSGTSWSQQGEKLTGAEEIEAGEFGSSVKLSDAGTTALIGGSGDNTFVGAAWVFTESGGKWLQQGPEAHRRRGVRPRRIRRQRRAVRERRRGADRRASRRKRRRCRVGVQVLGGQMDPAGRKAHRRRRDRGRRVRLERGARLRR